ncbi:MAG TPA: hypothetical protein PKW80_11875 [Bacteroidales bacterium]|nr:hypothetical protein [Bacteroidales bacterium]
MVKHFLNSNFTAFYFMKNFIVFLVLTMLSTQVFCQWQKQDSVAQFNEKIPNLYSNDRVIRENTLWELMLLKGNLPPAFDLKNKYQVFQNIIKIDAADYVYRAVHFLAGFPEDKEITKFSVSSVRSQSENKPELVGSLTYLEKFNIPEFNNYLTSKSYPEIDSMIRMIYYRSDIIRKKRFFYYNDLISSYIKHGAHNNSFGKDNPYRAAIVKDEYAIAEYIVDSLSKSAKDSLVIPAPVIGILGEAGTPNAFDLLLKEYLVRPSEKTGISLGSSLRSLNINILFNNTFKKEDDLKQLLAYVCGDDWEQIKNQGLEEIKKYMLKNLVKIISSCKNRSAPG